MPTVGSDRDSCKIIRHAATGILTVLRVIEREREGPSQSHARWIDLPDLALGIGGNKAGDQDAERAAADGDRTGPCAERQGACDSERRGIEAKERFRAITSDESGRDVRSE